MIKNPPASAGDTRDVDSTPGSGRSPEEENGSPLQYSCLENPMDRGAWRATVHRVTVSDTSERLSTCIVTEQEVTGCQVNGPDICGACPIRQGHCSDGHFDFLEKLSETDRETEAQKGEMAFLRSQTS